MELLMINGGWLLGCTYAAISYFTSVQRLVRRFTTISSSLGDIGPLRSMIPLANCLWLFLENGCGIQAAGCYGNYNHS